jgi:hypothetical protein
MAKAKKAAKEKDHSPVVRLFHHLWGENRTRSWREENDALQRTLMLAIEARLPFEPDDFKRVYDGYKGGYWMGEGEHYYAKAIELRNTAACQSFEKWKGRPAFIYNGNRLHVGSSFTFDGKTLHVTSYGRDHRGAYLGCVTYKKPETGSYSRKVDKRIKVSLAELKAGEPKKNLPKPEKDLRQAAEAFEDVFRCETAKLYLKTRLTLKSAWEGVPEYFKDGNSPYLESARRQMLELLRVVKFPVMLHEIDELKTVEQIYARVGDFEKNLQPLLLAAVKVRLAEKRAAKQAEKKEQS